MKKFLSILLGSVITVTAIALTSSCQKDIDNAKSLIGTEWVCATGEITYTLTFPTSTTFKMTPSAAGREFQDYTGVFIIAGAKSSLTGSAITLTPDSKWWEDEKETYVGEFKSETRLVVETFVFERK